MTWWLCVCLKGGGGIAGEEWLVWRVTGGLVWGVWEWQIDLFRCEPAPSLLGRRFG